MKKSTKWIIGAVIAVLLLTNLAGYLVGRKAQKTKDVTIAQLISAKQIFETSAKDKITRQEQRIVTLQQAKEALLINVAELKDKGIKDVQVIVDLKTENDRLQLQAQYASKPQVIHDTVVVNGSISIYDYIRVPMVWSFEDKWSSIVGTVKTDGVIIDSLITYSQPNVTLGWSRGFFKKSKPLVVFSDANPYNRVKDMSNVVIISNLPFYKKPWFYQLEGVIGTLTVQYGIRRIIK